MAKPLPRTPHSDEDMRQLLRSADAGGDLRQAVFFGSGLLEGLRLHEVTTLTYADALDDPIYLIVREGLRDSRHIPRAAWLDRRIRALRDQSPGPYVLGGDRPLRRDTVLGRWLWPARDMLPDLRYHDLRHWFIAALVEAVDGPLLGARDPQIFQRCADVLSAPGAAQAFAALERRLLGSAS